MSLSADTARTASNQTLALTLFWLIGVLEKSSERVAPSVALDMIHSKMSELDRLQRWEAEQRRIAEEVAA